MRVVESRYTVAPNTCCVTGRSDDHLVDFEVEVTGADQRIYMRRSVVEEAGALIGMVPKSEVDELREQMEDLRERWAKAEKVADAITSFEEAEANLEEAVSAA